MLYKPNFCCNCGEKILRSEWNLLTSRRFCEVCAVENKRYEMVSRFIVGGGILAAMLGLGAFFSGREAGYRPTGLLPDSQFATASDTKRPSRKNNNPVDDIRQSEQATSLAAIPVPQTSDPAGEPNGKDGRLTAFKNNSDASPVYYCGAPTKKGTPCSRRVKVKGARCWQHEGKSAAFPEN